MAANKSDLFQQEQVTEAEGKNYADEIGIIFQITSACTGVGINELFYNIGSKLLNPEENKPEIDAPEQRNNIQLKQSEFKEDNNNKSKGRCC